MRYSSTLPRLVHQNIAHLIGLKTYKPNVVHRDDNHAAQHWLCAVDAEPLETDRYYSINSSKIHVFAFYRQALQTSF